MILCDGAWWDQMKCVQHQDSSDVCAAWPGMWRLRTQRLAGSAPSPRRGRGPRAATDAAARDVFGRLCEDETVASTASRRARTPRRTMIIPLTNTDAKHWSTRPPTTQIGILLNAAPNLPKTPNLCGNQPVSYDSIASMARAARNLISTQRRTGSTRTRNERAQAIELSVLAAVSCRAANSRVFVGFGGAGAAITSKADARESRYIEARTLARASGL